MKLTVIQSPIAFCDKRKNFAVFENHFTSLAGTSDLIVLPEMFSTGFCTDKPELAESNDGQTVDFLLTWAKKGNFAIAGSFVACEDEKLYNRGFFVFPEGRVEFADKRHLFTVSGEDRFFSKGDKRLIVNYSGFNILLLVCYDLRFPVWARNVNNEYDVLLYAANFPQSRINSWDILLPARAVENQCYSAGVNIVGESGGIDYCGHSAVYDFKGKKLLDCEENLPCAKTVDIQIETLQKFRIKNAFWKDSDKFEIKF